MSDIFRTAGKFWIANIVSALGFVVGMVAFPVVLGLLSGVPMIPDLSGFVDLSMHAGLATGALGWAWVMMK